MGSEETLIAKLGVSRATVRQAARLLEREGFPRVRRGINGGYFAARPDVRTIEKAVSSYLEMVHTKPEDITVIASVFVRDFLQGPVAHVTRVMNQDVNSAEVAERRPRP